MTDFSKLTDAQALAIELDVRAEDTRELKRDLARQRLGPPGRLLRRVREEEDIEEENLRFVRSLRGDDDLQDAVERADAEETDEFLASAARAELDRLDALWAES